MDHHDWPEWAGDDSHVDPHLGDADTADLSHSDDPLADHLDHDAYGGGELPHDLSPEYGPDFGHEQGHSLGQDAYPDDSIDQPVDEPAHHSAGHEAWAPVDDAHHDSAGDDTADNTADDTADNAVHEGLAEHVVGTDPDVDPHAEDPGWHDADFPPHLDLDHVPPPVDGYPWSDPGVLGAGTVDDAGHLQSGWTDPSAGDLMDYAGLSGGHDTDAWHALLGSDDPATSALARWWAPS